MGLDDKINVASVYPDGLVKVWGWRKEDGSRDLVRKFMAGSYGKGKLWAEEYEAGQRRP